MSPISQPDQIWQRPPESYSLASDAVHVWRIDLSPPSIESAWSALSPDEQARAQRFRFDSDRNRYVLSHGALRVLLGCYLSTEPKEIVFRRGDHGKPALDHDSDLRFNLSTSHKVALLAVTIRREVGIDIEYRRADFADRHTARRFFSPREIEALNAVPPEKYTEAFFNCWTRKEAYIKAIGLGLSMPLDQFSVSLQPGEPAQLLEVVGQPQEVERWSMIRLEPGGNYAAALVVEGQGGIMQQYDYGEIG